VLFRPGEWARYWFFKSVAKRRSLNREGHKFPAPYRMFTASNETTDDSPEPLARSCSGTSSRPRVSLVLVKFLPVVLDNSEEEIGWKARPQSSNLWQEII
jgi:hypothetical protein